MEESGNIKSKIAQLELLLQNVQEFHKRIDTYQRGSWDYMAYSTATVKEFELLYEVFWKFLKIYVEEYIGSMDTGAGPRSVFKESFERNLVSVEEFDLLQKTIRSRNDATHIYLQEIADQVIQQIPRYLELMRTIIYRLTN